MAELSLLGSENLPSIANATLPSMYTKAKEALAECERIDECKTWADKAAALASYAKQADDDTLHKTAVRIRARAIRRCGELLKDFDARPQNPQKQSHANGTLLSQRQAAADAGLSKRQQVTAVNVARVPEEQFEAAIESEKPPTITALADQGKKAQPKAHAFDLQGRDPEDFKRSTEGQSHLEALTDYARRIQAETLVKGTLPHEYPEMRAQLAILLPWLKQLEKLLP